MNKTTHIFSPQRFGLLLKREIILRKTFLLTSIAAVLIAIFGVTLIVVGSDRNFRGWNQEDYAILFLIVFSILGILYSGTAFPAYRNSKKTMDFLLIPNSLTEKYLFEVLFRIVLYMVFFPVMFWMMANLAGSLINAVTIDDYNLTYHFWTPLNVLREGMDYSEGIASIMALIVFLISIPFTGAAYFVKSPLFKTIIFLALLIGASLLYGWFLDQMLNFTHTPGFDPDISPGTGLNLLTAFLILSTLVLHASSFMKLKEKEV